MNITIIVGIIVVIAHVASAIAKESAKRKEKERVQQEAERRRIAIGTMTPPAQVQGTNAAPTLQAPTSVQSSRDIGRSGQPVDELVVQRKAQLEQLRVSREADIARQPQLGRRIAAPPGSIRQGNSLPQSRPRDRADVIGKREQMAAERESAKAKRRQQQIEVRNRDAQIKVRPEPDVAVAAVSNRNQSRAALVAAAADGLAYALQPVQQGRLPAPVAARQGVHERLRNPLNLRGAIVMAEVLGPPLALRQDR